MANLKTTKPIVSIVMSTYNDGDYLEQAIKSILHQTFSKWELIIINDASTDSTNQILNNYIKKDQRIIYIKNTKRKGYIPNLNRGVSLSRGQFIARLDSDDYWSGKNKLRNQVNFLEKNLDYGLVGTWAIICNQHNKEIYKAKYSINDSTIRNRILKEASFVHSSIMMRKKIFLKAGGYNISYLPAEDYALWLKLGTLSKFHNIPKFLIHYRINPQGISQKNYRIQNEKILELIKIFKHNYPHFLIAQIIWKLRALYPVRFRSIIYKLRYLLLKR